MNAIDAAKEMLDRLAKSAAFSLQSKSVSLSDRRGYEADLRLRPLHDRLISLGWLVETSTQGSVYYSRGEERIRLSNHEVPMTAERNDAAWTWARCGWKVTSSCGSLKSCMDEIDEIEEAVSE